MRSVRGQRVKVSESEWDREQFNSESTRQYPSNIRIFLKNEIRTNES